MSLTQFPSLILEIILARLAPLFLAVPGVDANAARQAANEMLAAHQPKTEHELRLAAEIIGFGLHALQALAQAAGPDMTMIQQGHLRASAATLSRQSHGAQRKLDQLQKARRAMPRHEPQVPEAETAPPRQTVAIEQSGPPQPRVPKPEGQSWSKAFRQRQTAKRIAENLKKKQATSAVLQTMPAPAPVQPGAMAP